MIIDPNVESLVVAYLRGALPVYGLTMPVGTTVPNPRPTESVTVYRTGGIRRDIVTDQPQITIDVRAGTEKRAVYIIGFVRGLVNELDKSNEFDGNQVQYVEELAGPGNLPDPISGIRYTMSFSISIRSAEFTL